MKAIMILLRTDLYTDWSAICSRILKDPNTFIKQLKSYKVDSITEQMHKKIRPIIASEKFKEFRAEATKSSAAVGL